MEVPLVAQFREVPDDDVRRRRQTEERGSGSTLSLFFPVCAAAGPGAGAVACAALLTTNVVWHRGNYRMPNLIRNMTTLTPT